MKFSFLLFCPFFFSALPGLQSQISEDITFEHAGKTVHATFQSPDSPGPHPVVIITPGSGPNDRHGTIVMTGPNIECLYPDLLNDTLTPYKDLAVALVDAGYAVLRYDKLEYTYPTSLGEITFHKLWLVVDSAIDYVKSRADVDSSAIILLGHSEGSTLIPFIAKDRADIKALISLAGARTPFDTILADQIVDFSRRCDGDTAMAKFQAYQILAYFDMVRKQNWNAGTPPLFGVSPAVWYDYFQATDPVAQFYNDANVPTLFIGLALDINVPPAELDHFANEVTITDDFWLIPDLIHYMTPNDNPHVSATLTDTIIYWLQEIMSTGTSPDITSPRTFNVFPNPFDSILHIDLLDQRLIGGTLNIYSSNGENVFSQKINAVQFSIPEVRRLTPGTYIAEISKDGLRTASKEIIRQ